MDLAVFKYKWNLFSGYFNAVSQLMIVLISQAKFLVLVSKAAMKTGREKKLLSVYLFVCLCEGTQVMQFYLTQSPLQVFSKPFKQTLQLLWVLLQRTFFPVCLGLASFAWSLFFVIQRNTSLIKWQKFEVFEWVDKCAVFFNFLRKTKYFLWTNMPKVSYLGLRKMKSNFRKYF